MKVKKILSSIAAAVLCLSAIGSVTANASGIYRVNPFVGNPQDKSKWCWVASAQTSADHFALSTKSQWQAVYEVRNTTNDVSGTTNDIADAANYFLSNSSANGLYNYVSYNRAKDFAFLKAQMMFNRVPIICGYGNVGNGYYNHATVVYMVTENSDNTRGVGYYDSHGNRVHITNYEDFRDGISSGAAWHETCYAE